MSHKKIIIKNTISNIAMQIISAIVPFVLLPYLLRYFGKETYGIFILAYSVYTFMLFLNSAIHLTLMKYVSEAYELKDFRRLNIIINDFWVIAFLNNLVVSIILVLIANYGVKWFNISGELLWVVKKVFYVMGMLGVVNGCLIVSDGVMSGLQKIHENNIFRAIEAILKVIAVIVIITFGKSLVLYVFFLNIIPILIRIPQVIYLKTIFPQMTLNFFKYLDWREFKKLIRFSGYQIVNQVSDILMYNTDKLIIQKILGSASIVMYEIANKPNLLFQRFISLPLAAILPACSAAYARDDKEFLNKMLIKGTRIYLTLVLPVIFAFIIYMKPFLKLWVGEEYMSVAVIAQLFLSTFIVACPFKVFSHMMVGKARVFEYGITKFIYAIINVPLSIYFIIRLGIIGGVIVTVGFWFLVHIPTNLYIMRKENINTVRFLKKILPVYFALVSQYFLFNLLSKNHLDYSWVALGSSIIFVIISGVAFSGIFILKKDERSLLGLKV